MQNRLFFLLKSNFSLVICCLLFGANYVEGQSVSIKKCEYIKEINANATPESNVGNDFIYTADGGYLVTGNILLGGSNQEPITKKFGTAQLASKLNLFFNRQFNMCWIFSTMINLPYRCRFVHYRKVRLVCSC